MAQTYKSHNNYYLLVKRMRVSNACNMNFRLFIVLGDELFIYLLLLISKTQQGVTR